MLDSAPAYPLSNHTGAPWSVWSVLWRLRLFGDVRIFLFEVTLSGSGFMYIDRCSRCRYGPYVLLASALLCPATFGYSCLRSPCLVSHFASCWEVGRQHVSSGIHEVLIGATVYPPSNRTCEPWSVFRRTAVVPESSSASALVMSGGIWKFVFEVSVSVLGFTRCLEVPRLSLERSCE